MHTLGFWHEQSRPDRDEHVDIREQSIMQNRKDNFDIVSYHHPAVMNSPYDICSLMHYDAWAFHKNRTPKAKPIIENKKNKQCWSRGREYKMGNAPTFTRSDLKRINDMYKCS